MVERAPLPRRDEQYPLLKVAGGGGDGGAYQQPSPALPAPVWGVTTTPKNTWSFRWPENFSASKTFIWLGILFILFYPLGKEVYRRQPVLVSKCKTSKPASDVYYHVIVQRGSLCPFMLYADYLSDVATQYPSLCFHVILLEDDSLKLKRRCPGNAILFDSYDHFPFTSSYDTKGILEISDFQRRYENVNVTVMALSKYMEKIPLHHNWRNIPHSHLTFYARIFSVWQNGGVAMDLNYFNDNYNDLKRVTRRVAAILKQHNDGIKVEEYTNALNKIDREEENEFFTIFYGLVHQILNETRTFFTKSFPFTQITTETGVSQNGHLVRTNRNKRDVSTPLNDKNNKSEVVPNVYVKTKNATKETDLKKNEILSNPNVNRENLKHSINDSSKPLQMNTSIKGNSKNKTEKLNKPEIQTKTKNKTETPGVALFYDFSVFSNGTAPSQVLPETEIKKAGKSRNNRPLLSFESNGMFVAASSKQHPFLRKLISFRCPRIHPKYAIQDLLLSQCSGLFAVDTYCNNIYLL